MKFVAWFLVVLLVLAIAGVGYLYSTSGVEVESISAQAYEAQNQQPTFDDLKRRLENGSVVGTVFQNQPLGASTDYAFFTYTVRLRNNSLIAADMVEVQVVPTDMDILQMGSASVRTLPPRSKGEFSATVLSRRDSGSARELIITYYIWGKPFVLRKTYGN